MRHSLFLLFHVLLSLFSLFHLRFHSFYFEFNYLTTCTFFSTASVLYLVYACGKMSQWADKKKMQFNTTKQCNSHSLKATTKNRFRISSWIIENICLFYVDLETFLISLEHSLAYSQQYSTKNNIVDFELLTFEWNALATFDTEQMWKWKKKKNIKFQFVVFIGFCII